MKLARIQFSCSCIAIALASNVAAAERGEPSGSPESTQKSDAPAAEAAPPAPAPSDEHADWWRRYEEARLAFVEQRYEEAAHAFEALRLDATTAEQRRVALELQLIASSLHARYQTLERHPLRTPDEISLLYSTAFIYGFGSSAWLALQTKPQTFAGAVLPFALFTTASVGAVAVADGYRPFPRGVPHAIASGTLIGSLEGVWIVGLQHANATLNDDGSRFSSAEVSTVLWAGATAGGVVGSVVGFVGRPQPGHTSFAASSATWTGGISALAMASLDSDTDRRGQLAFASGGIGFNVGLAAGALSAPWFDTSVARIRFVDLGGVAGALLGAGAYTLAANDSANVRGGYAAAAAGAGLGLGLSWWLTADMPKESARAGPEPQETLTGSLRPVILPAPGGAVLGLGGEL